MIETLKIISDISAIGLAALAIIALIVIIKKRGFKNIINDNKQIVQLDRIEKNHLSHIEVTGKRAVQLLEKMDDKLDNIKLMNQRIFDKLDK